MTALLVVLAFAFAWSIGSHYTGACMGMPHALGAVSARGALALMAPLALADGDGGPARPGGRDPRHCLVRLLHLHEPGARRRVLFGIVRGWATAPPVSFALALLAALAVRAAGVTLAR